MDDSKGFSGISQKLIENQVCDLEKQCRKKVKPEEDQKSTDIILGQNKIVTFFCIIKYINVSNLLTASILSLVIMAQLQLDLCNLLIIRSISKITLETNE